MAQVRLTSDCTLDQRRRVRHFLREELGFDCGWDGNQLIIADRKTGQEIPISILDARDIKKLPGVESVDPSGEPVED